MRLRREVKGQSASLNDRSPTKGPETVLVA